MRHCEQYGRDAEVGVRQNREPIDAEMLADRFDIFHIVMNPAREFRRVDDGVRQAAVARVVEDRGVIRRQTLKILEHVDPVGDKNRVRRAPY
jgi:hypothetical protein